MNRILTALCAATVALLPVTSAQASLPRGARAPDFATQGAMDGRAFSFRLSQALRRGAVVLYFYPKAFTQGCTAEAHAFAEAMPDFAAAGATMVGMSNDDLPTLRKFSTEACRSRFAVARANPQVIRAYDVALLRDGVDTGLASRTSYVIARDGRITMVHSDMDWRNHVRLTLAAVQRLQVR